MLTIEKIPANNNYLRNFRQKMIDVGGKSANVLRDK